MPSPRQGAEAPQGAPEVYGGGGGGGSALQGHEVDLDEGLPRLALPGGRPAVDGGIVGRPQPLDDPGRGGEGFELGVEEGEGVLLPAGKGRKSGRVWRGRQKKD